MANTTLGQQRGFAARFNAYEARRAFYAQRINFLQDLGVMMMEGKGSVVGMLTSLAKRTPSSALSAAFVDVRETAKGGSPLHEGLRPYYNDLEGTLIEAVNLRAKTDADRGEGFVTVAEMMRQIERTQSGMGKLFVAAVRVVVIVLLTWLGLGLFAAKQFEQLVPRTAWSDISVAVVSGGEFVLSVWPLSLGVLVGGGLLLTWAMPKWTGKRRKWADQNVPGFVLYRMVQATPIQMAMGAYLAAGLPFERALDILAGKSSRWVRMYLDEMRGLMRGRLGVDIVDVGLFDWQAMARVEVRSAGSKLDEALQYVAVQSAPVLVALLEERIALARTALSAVQNILLALVGLGIGLI